MIRITSDDDQKSHKWERFSIEINSNGTFSEIKDIYPNSYKDGHTFQVIVFKNHINPDEKHWEKDEEVYKFVGGTVAYDGWKNIVVVLGGSDVKVDVGDGQNPPPPANNNEKFTKDMLNKPVYIFNDYDQLNDQYSIIKLEFSDKNDTVVQTKYKYNTDITKSYTNNYKITSDGKLDIEGFGIFSILDKSDKYLKVDRENSVEGYLFFDENELINFHKEKISTQNGENEQEQNPYLPITENILKGKTFYYSFKIDDDSILYGKKSFLSLSTVTGEKIITGLDGTIKSKKSYESSYKFVDGKQQVETESERLQFTLLSKDDNAWYLKKEIDKNKNGNYEKAPYDAIWYFKKPSSFPEFSDEKVKYIPITEDLLKGQKFYEKDFDDSGYAYTVMTLSASNGTRHEMWYDNNDSLREDEEPFTFSYTILNGKIKIDTGKKFIWLTLISKDAKAWSLISEEDKGKNGTIDRKDKNTFYLSKPVGFPDNL
jgi:hypothetical protein